MGSNPIGRTILVKMFIKLVKRFMLRVATMSKKTAVAFIIVMVLDFFAALTMMYVGLLYLRPDVTPPDFAIPLTIAGSVLLFVDAILIMLSSLSSNYVEKKMTPEEKEAIKQKYHFKD